MNNEVMYTARFFDSNYYELEWLTKSFESFRKVSEYFKKIVETGTMAFAQIDKNNQAISARFGYRIGADDDSRIDYGENINDYDIKTVKVKLYHDCSERAIFRGLGDDKDKWFIRLYNGDWCCTSPCKDYWEYDNFLKVPYRFLICDSEFGEEYAVDSNVPELAVKPFVPLDAIEKGLREKYLKLEGNMGYEEWVEAILYELSKDPEFEYKSDRRDSYLYDKLVWLRETEIDNVEYAGRQHKVKQQFWRHNDTGITYSNYVLDINGTDHNLCVYKIEQEA